MKRNLTQRQKYIATKALIPIEEELARRRQVERAENLHGINRQKIVDLSEEEKHAKLERARINREKRKQPNGLFFEIE